MDLSKKLLTKEDCCKTLKYFVNSDNVSLKSYTTNKLSSIEGLVGEHYKLKIIYEEDALEKEANLFVKIVAGQFKEADELMKSIKAYEKEEFYLVLMKEFEACGMSTSFAPKFYYSRQPLLILEDLSLRQYVNAPKHDMLNIKHCKVALKTLAKFHATNILYEKIKSSSDDTYTNLDKKYADLLEDVLFSKTRNAAKDWLESTFKGILALIDLLPKSDISAETYKSKLLEIFELLSKNHSDSSTNCISTVLHGDLWSNNFMFKYENDIPVDSILIDYQLVKYGPIASDVAHLIVTNVRRDVRKIHFEELVSYYYHQFAEACDAHGFDAHNLVSYKDFVNSCEELKFVAKIECVADHSITFLIGAVEEAMQTEEGAAYEMIFGDRSKSMIHSYKNDDLYREIMTEDLIELRDLLFENN